MSSRYGVVASNAWGKYDVLDTETDEVVASGLITYAQAISAAENYNDREPGGRGGRAVRRRGRRLVSTYRCNRCGAVVERDSEKRWIRSWCETTGTMTRLWRVTLEPR